VETVPCVASFPESQADALAIEKTNKSEIRVSFNDVQAVVVRPFEAVPGLSAPSSPSTLSPASDESSQRHQRPGALSTLAAERETSVRSSGWSWAHLVNPVLGLLWLSGAVVLAVWYCIGRIRVAQLQRRFWTVDDEQRLANVAGLARQLGVRRRVRLVESDRLSGPVTYGIVRPTIALPVDFSKRFGSPQQKTVLAHELSHIASWDAAWQFTADCVACLLWWQPLVWWLRRQFRATCETAADEASLLLPDGPDVLAECLVALGRQQAGSSGVAWLWVAGKKSNLTERVESLLRLTQHAGGSRRIVGGRLLRVFVLMVMTVVAVTGATWLHPSEALAEKDLTMKSMWKRSLAGVTLMAVLGTAAGTLTAQEEERDVESVINIDIRHEIELDLHEDAESDCKVEWEGDWYDAKVLKKEGNSWYVHYIDDDDSYDEWVGKDRIRFEGDTPERGELDELREQIKMLRTELAVMRRLLERIDQR
jgi:beta-lactamase regulating signal transducer with metallopeptidase domain